MLILLFSGFPEEFDMPQLDPMLTMFYRYWETQCGSRALPRRSDIDPADIPALLPHLQLIDVIADGRFRFRLVGTAIVTAFGGELTGRYFDEVMTPARLALAARHYHVVCETKRPVYVRAAYSTSRNGDIVASRVIAPLSADGVSVNMVMALQTFDYGTLLHSSIDAGANVGASANASIPLPVGTELTPHLVFGDSGTAPLTSGATSARR
jgi:hypothetical protein